MYLCVLTEDLKKSDQVYSVDNTNDFPSIQKKEPLQHFSCHELKNIRLLGRIQEENINKRPCPETINDPEPQFSIDESSRDSGIDRQEHIVEYNDPPGFSNLNNRIVSEEKNISTAVYPNQISDNSINSNIAKIPKTIKLITREDYISNKFNPVMSSGKPPKEISSYTFTKRAYHYREKDIPGEITAMDKEICPTDLPPLSPTSKNKIIKEAKRFARLAGTAYFEYTDLKEWKCNHCIKAGKYKYLKTINVPTLKLQCIILIDQNRRDLVISFRGSKDMGQVTKLISIKKIPYKLFKPAKVQIKLEERTEAISKKIARYLKPIINDYRCYRKVLVGHSLGGAMAVLAAPRISRRFGIPYSDIAVYTYGQPRVGDEAFANWYNKKIHTIRIVNGRDPVPHTPQKVFGFSHTHRELFLEDGETLCSNSSLEDDKCSNEYWFNVALPRTHRSVWDSEI